MIGIKAWLAAFRSALDAAPALKVGGPVVFPEMSQALPCWSQQLTTGDARSRG